ncbi:MAG TPA: hypothetical protein VEX65_01915, partial [Flavisolibacter sp.]|nr:hypothetical protein [Flavisolibacter sp.]
MEKIKAKTTVLVMLLSFLSVTYESCRKPDVDEQEKSNQDNTNAIHYTKQYPADVATEWFTLLTE